MFYCLIGPASQLLNRWKLISLNWKVGPNYKASVISLLKTMNYDLPPYIINVDAYLWIGRVLPWSEFGVGQVYVLFSFNPKCSVPLGKLGIKNRQTKNIHHKEAEFLIERKSISSHLLPSVLNTHTHALFFSNKESWFLIQNHMLHLQPSINFYLVFQDAWWAEGKGEKLWTLI